MGYDPFSDSRLVDTDQYVGRLRSFLSMDNQENLAGKSVLVPGSALGGECLAALELKAETVTGLEVLPELIEAASLVSENRLTYRLFDGAVFPQPNDSVDLVLSGHVIEHTENWKKHLEEVIRVIKPGGAVYLEFPSRFSARELHTNLIGFEWMPRLYRNTINLLFARVALLFGFSEYAQKRQSILTLQQVSALQIRLQSSKLRFRVAATEIPVRGIVRMVLVKGQ